MPRVPGTSSGARRTVERNPVTEKGKPAHQVEMGTCPICDETIFASQHTVWKLGQGKPVRVHGICLDPPITRRPTSQ